MAIDPLKYRAVLGHFATGVTIITGIFASRPIGFTIGSFTSVSLDPPLVGFLPMVASERWQEIRQTGAFCVNVLAADQAALCWNFSKITVAEPFEGVDWRPAPGTGSPIVEGSVAWIDCTIDQVVEAGDHHFVMGLIQEFDHAEADADPAPLLFYKGKLGGYEQHA